MNVIKTDIEGLVINQIVNGVPDPFVESLTHDSIIVQIPYLRGRLRNRPERVLQVFDQEYCVKGNNIILKLMRLNLQEMSLS